MTDNHSTLISLNVGKAEKLPDGKPTKTGINKRPTEDICAIVDLGIDGDAICNLKPVSYTHLTLPTILLV